MSLVNEEQCPKLGQICEQTQKTRNTIVMKGFGDFTLPPQAVYTEIHKFYPPLSNASYLFDYHRPSEFEGDIMRSSWTPTLDGVAFVKAQLRLQKVRDEQALGPKDPTHGERVAQNISWETQRIAPKDTNDIMVSNMNLSDNRATFVKNIDKAIEHGKDPFMFCERCKRKHIPWGPPLTLNDRDTCLSMLPEWFPAERYDKPWDAFIGLCNDMVKLDEIEKGLASDRDSSDNWGKNYHSPSREWRLVGRREGWWKCRTGKENGETGVSEVERTCKLCHGPGMIDKRPNKSTISDRKKQIEEWIERRMKDVMRKDQEYVIKRAREQVY